VLNYKKYYEDNNNLNQIVKSLDCVWPSSMDISNRRVRVLLILKLLCLAMKSVHQAEGKPKVLKFKCVVGHVTRRVSIKEVEC
jgi:hypothetical protein